MKIDENSIYTCIKNRKDDKKTIDKHGSSSEEHEWDNME